VQFISFRRQYPAWLFPGETDRDSSREPIHPNQVEYLLDPLMPQTWARVAHRIGRYDPDWVILHWWVPFWAAPFRAITASVRRRTGAKVIFICHNVFPHESSRLGQFWVRLGMGKGQRFITHSPDQKEQLQAVFPQAPICCTPHPTYAAFDTGKWQKKTARRELGFEAQDNLLLFFGFVRPYKGLRYLLEAMPMVLERIPVHLLVVGEFWKGKSETEEQIAQLGLADRVTLVDRYVPNEEVALFFRAADLVVLPYESATGSGVLQIALGLGCPAVVTDMGGLREIVVHGETGLVVPPRDSTALARAIIRYFGEGLGSTFVENIHRYQARFSWDALLDAIEGLGEAVC
jgi:glycosyltransferase involved in cell wall biosynthesis